MVFEALSYQCMRPYATSVCGLNLLVYETLSYLRQLLRGNVVKNVAKNAGKNLTQSAVVKYISKVQ
jgi:hypothetical protein